MPTPLKLLLVEDNPHDAELMLRELRRGDFAVECHRVQSEEEFLAGLPEGFDLVLSDFALPQFNGLRALELLKQSGADVPFILVSATIGEETAVTAIKQGAADYLLKDRLIRLGPAVSQALEQHRLRRDRRQADEALRESEERFRQVVENIQEVFWLRDVRADRIIYMSPGFEKIWGRSRDELYASAQAWSESIREEDRERVRQASADKRNSGGYDETFRILRPDGAERWIRARTFPVKDADGQVHRIVGVAEDVTERKKLEDQFLHAQRMEAIGTLASGVAHDLNNILAPMLMVAGLLKDTAATDKDREMLAMIEQSGQRGAGIIRQLLTFSRGISGDRVTVQFKHLIKEMTEIMRETFPRNITVVEKVPPRLPTIEGDPTQLHQVIMNLCVNARDAMLEGGKVTLAAGAVTATESAPLDPSLKPGDYLMFSVQDTGHGISAADIGRIFDPFFTTKAVGKGTGLGLSTVVGIVKSHGGAIKVSSEPDKGTEFTVYLPVSIERRDPSQAGTPVPAPRGQGERILVIDDEEPICEALRGLLERNGYRVLLAHSGEEGLKLFVQHLGSVRLILTDLMMPGLGGLDLIRAARILEPGIVVIANSGLDEDHNRDELTALGVRAILPKPCQPEILLGAISSALTR